MKEIMMIIRVINNNNCRYLLGNLFETSLYNSSPSLYFPFFLFLIENQRFEKME